MNIRTMCLAILSFGEATGYDIKKRWAEGPFSHFAEASFGSIYPALARLEEEGLVTFHEEREGGKPPRKIYAITEAGREAFAEAMSRRVEPDSFRSPFAITALCAEHLTPAIIENLIRDRLAHQRRDLAELETLHGLVAHPATRWLIGWGIAVHRSEIDFMERHGQELVALAGRRSGLDPSFACMGTCGHAAPASSASAAE